MRSARTTPVSRGWAWGCLAEGPALAEPEAAGQCSPRVRGERDPGLHQAEDVELGRLDLLGAASAQQPAPMCLAPPIDWKRLLRGASVTGEKLPGRGLSRERAPGFPD